MRTVLFINAHSRRAHRHLDRIPHDFEKAAGFEVLKTIIVDELGSLDQKLKELKAVPELECVIVGSGDGTIVSVLNALKGRHITYGFLPLGTSNTFVRSLELPSNYLSAKRIILKQTAKPVPLGSVNGVLFANIAGAGVPVDVTENTTNQTKRWLGPLAYVWMGLRALRFHTALECHIQTDSLDEHFYTHYLLIANGPYHGNLPLKKDMKIFDNQLLLIAIGTTESRLHFANGIVRLFFRTHEKDPKVRMIPFEQARLTITPPRSIEADGEIIAKTPAEVRIVKNAIRVFTRPPKPVRKTRRTPRRRS